MPKATRSHITGLHRLLESPLAGVMDRDTLARAAASELAPVLDGDLLARIEAYHAAPGDLDERAAILAMPALTLAAGLAKQVFALATAPAVH